ncbi:MAG TPA: class I SAM-dependent methyltransferase [Tepidiformaceae bacterium]|nr:class I SAM-dependent methyltransferase [Tepidiformaceae bacterium]
MLKRIPEPRIRECLDDAAASPMASPGVRYPRWYVHRWHFLPEGYLSRRSAVLYDAVIRRIYNVGSETRLHAALVDALFDQRPERVLELACGPGNALSAVRTALPRADLTGIDLSPFLLELARDRLAGADVSLVHGNATRLPWTDASFDAVVAQHFLGHLPRHVRQPAWDAAAGVLRPGGRLYVIDHAWHPRLPRELRNVDSTRLLGGIVRLDIFERPTGGQA